MDFVAKFDGECSLCHQTIKGGEDLIKWSRKSRNVWHSACPAVPGSAAGMPIENPKGDDSMPDYTETEVVMDTDDTDADDEAIRKTLMETLQKLNAAKAGKRGLNPEAMKQFIESWWKTESQNYVKPDDMSKALSTYAYKLSDSDKLDLVDVIDDRISSRMVKQIVITQDDKEPKKFDMAHELLERLVKLVNTKGLNGHRLNIYMHGPAGSGKSSAARQAAVALGLPFGYASLNPMTPDSRAMGFMHAGGEYVPTEFFRRYTTGGVFCFDEIDNSSASFVTTLNSTLENGHGAFPHGVFERHPDFVCICTANTVGRGGDIHYPERRALDSAFLERFIFLDWPYDDKLTRAIVGAILGEGLDAHMDWTEKKAEQYRARYPELVISPRAFIQGALLKANGFSKDFIEAAAIRRGIKDA